ncbi:aspartyl/asparaginyl beta-hydroxylase domain-containing protein [Streptomyces roseirectus]|uniref:Aspartyl/asparaginyl beta-hydroxylase domain-containing protein n=1 Tax=Streptomyces roseirectus TaxID=2768066 RepID=A0A7H0IQN8_9ACTN|nr:aspartyl/asparaginyl beta-hydroxylase domain-containing protein [Streptomyces roseirectus]QNP75104.1 aspartyl/asparaginyl beta-hydroxylase domain-containing protein [Streptomyces roseirectus]
MTTHTTAYDIPVRDEDNVDEDAWPRAEILAGLPATARLALDFSPELLLADLERLGGGAWGRPQYTDGSGASGDITGTDWRNLPLHSIGGHDDRHDAGGPQLDDFAPAPRLAEVPYLREVLESIPAPIRSARLFALGPGAVSPEHHDTKASFPWGWLRLHIPIVTLPEAVLRIDGGEHCWSVGGLWYADFSRPHQVVNTGTGTRVHLVVDTHVTRELMALFPPEFHTPEVLRSVPYHRAGEDLKDTEAEALRCRFPMPRSYADFQEREGEFTNRQPSVDAAVDWHEGRLTLFLDGEPSFGLVHMGEHEFRFAGWVQERTLQIVTTADGTPRVVLRTHRGAETRTLELPAEPLPA